LKERVSRGEWISLNGSNGERFMKVKIKTKDAELSADFEILMKQPTNIRPWY
jgi:hypothetical protein